MKAEIASDPPLIKEHHVRFPDQVARLLGATQLQKRGITGENIRVAIIDSGFFLHPFYVSRGYKIRHITTQGSDSPDKDEYGHGTALLASLFAVSPSAEALAIKCVERDPCPALEKAISLKPHVLNCAWGFNIDHADRKRVPTSYRKIYQLIQKAVEQGICVVAAAGNGQRAFPGSMPEVISAGGVYYAPDGRFEPSDVSSKFESGFFPGRRVPDVCGLVGNKPHGRLLLVPVPPKAKLARRPAFSMMGESSSMGHGWALFSGTSAATAMISGACALLLQMRPGLSPRQLKRVLIEASRPVLGCRLIDVEAASLIAESF